MRITVDGSCNSLVFDSRPDFLVEIVGGGGKIWRRCSGLAHDPNGKFFNATQA
jgi:hypothetical protein